MTRGLRGYSILVTYFIYTSPFFPTGGGESDLCCSALHFIPTVMGDRLGWESAQGHLESFSGRAGIPAWVCRILVWHSKHHTVLEGESGKSFPASHSQFAHSEGVLCWIQADVRKEACAALRNQHRLNILNFGWIVPHISTSVFSHSTAFPFLLGIHYPPNILAF